METEADFYELLRYCPLDCPFLRKKKDAYTFLCLSYKSFLHVNEKGRVMRHHLCGAGIALADYTAFKNLLKKLGKESPLTFTRETVKLLENIFAVLDTTEQLVMDTLMQSNSLAEQFTKQVEKMANSNIDNLLSNIRNLLDEYEQSDAFDHQALEWKAQGKTSKTARKSSKQKDNDRQTHIEETQKHQQFDQIQKENEHREFSKDIQNFLSKLVIQKEMLKDVSETSKQKDLATQQETAQQQLNKHKEAEKSQKQEPVRPKEREPQKPIEVEKSKDESKDLIKIAKQQMAEINKKKEEEEESRKNKEAEQKQKLIDMQRIYQHGKGR